MLRTLLLAMCLPLTSALAQQPGPGQGGDGYGRRASEASPPSSNSVIDRALRAPEEGPPPADTLATILDLSQLQRDRYSAAWDSLQVVTQAIRDSMAVQVEVVRSAVAQGYQDAAKDRVVVIDRLAKTLHKRNEAFDHSLRDYLTKEQIKLYQKYREAHQARPLPQARERRRQT